MNANTSLSLLKLIALAATALLVGLIIYLIRNH